MVYHQPLPPHRARARGGLTASRARGVERKGAPLASRAANAPSHRFARRRGQSVSVGVPHAFAHGARWAYDDAFTQAGLIPTATSAAALVAALADGGLFAAEGYAVPPSALEDAGVPRDATDRMVARADKLLFSA